MSEHASIGKDYSTSDRVTKLTGRTRRQVVRTYSSVTPPRRALVKKVDTELRIVRSPASAPESGAWHRRTGRTIGSPRLPLAIGFMTPIVPSPDRFSPDVPRVSSRTDPRM